MLKEVEKKKKKGCTYYFKIIDNLVLRPIFIYKYELKKNLPEFNFNDMLQEYGEIKENIEKEENLPEIEAEL